MNVVFTDVGEEIDDEVMFHVTTQTSKSSTWFFVCVPGASSANPEDAAMLVMGRLKRFKDLFPFLKVAPGGNHYYWESSLGSTFYVGPPSMMNTDGLVVDNLIRIAPLWHIDPNYFEQFGLIKNYIAMGDLANPDQSLNLTKAIPAESRILRSQYDDQHRVIWKRTNQVLSIPTSLARNVALPFALVNALPDCLREPLLNTAFTQCVGRVPAHLCYANNVSVVNHKTILNYLVEPGQIDLIPNDARIKIGLQVEQFLVQASEKDQFDMAYRTRLEEIASAIYILTGGIPYRDGGTFDKSSLLDPDCAMSRWMEHVEIHSCDLTPCYDLLALVVMEKGYVPDLEECRAVVNSYL